MQMGNRLAGSRPVVEHKPIAGLGQAELPGDFGGLEQQMTEHLLVRWLGLGHARDAFFGDNQHVRRRLRFDVMERDDLRVLEHNIGRNLPRGDSLKQSLAHEPRLAARFAPVKSEPQKSLTRAINFASNRCVQWQGPRAAMSPPASGRAERAPTTFATIRRSLPRSAARAAQRAIPARWNLHQISMRQCQPVLEVSGLSVRRGRAAILDAVSWRVERGQHWVLLGANGSGKTSLLSAVTGYLTPTAGEITVLGRRYGRSDWRELRKHIGLVSSAIRQMMANDEPALETVVSGKYAMIDFWGRATPRDRAQARRLLDQIECRHLAERPWLVLSQGERQRILIGRALMARPRLLVLDEPCAGLDVAAREHFLQFLERLGRRPDAPTLVLVTHHVEEITPVFSHVLVLKDGRVLVTGRKKAVLTTGVMSRALATATRLRRKKNRYALDVVGKTRGVV